MFHDFILRAFIGGIGVAMVAGALGCFIVWRKMAYFGDSLAHSALLGIALGLLYGFSINLGTVIICSLFALILVWLQHTQQLATDTLLGILAHGALAIGIVAISLLDGQRMDLYSYLFGDILTISTEDLYWIYGGGAVVTVLLIRHWDKMVLTTISADLARAEGIKTFWMNLLVVFLVTIVVAASIRVVGILLITSMLVIPAATARQLARSPESMAVISSMLGIIAVILGILASNHWDIPSGPGIVATSASLFATIFICIQLKTNLFRRRDL